MTSRTTPIALCVLAAIVLGFWLRAAPGLSGDTRFTYDSALHYRMTQRAEAGALGDTDRLRLHPEGVRVESLHPTGLYDVGAAFHAFVGGRDGSMARSLRIFTALCGALIAIPVALLARLIWRSHWAAALAAVTIAVLPAHVTRTASSLLRFDAFGSLLIALHVAAVALMLTAESTRIRRLAGAGIVVTLLAVLAVWRVGVALFVVEALVLALLLVGTDRRRDIGLAALLIAVGFIAGNLIPYFRDQSIALSHVVLPALWIALAAFALSRMPRLEGHVARIVTVAVTLGVAAVAGRLVPESAFDAQEGLAASTLWGRIGLGEPDAFAARLYAYIQELSMPGLGAFASAGHFSWAIVLAIVGIGSACIHRRKACRIPAAIYVAMMGALWIIAALLMERSKLLAAIPIAVACAGVATLALPNGRSVRRLALVGLTLGVLIATAKHSLNSARALTLDADPATRRLCEWIATRVPPEEALMTDWGVGYLLQTYARRPTFTDGHLELGLNRQRILARSQAMVSESEQELATLCRANDIGYLLLDIRWNWLPFVYTELTGGDALRGDEIRLPESANRTTIYQLFEAPENLTSFSEVYRTGPWRLLKVE